MPRLIVCRNCTESDCTYCNVNILAVALERGYFNSLMGEQHTVQIDSELVPVRHGYWIGVSQTKFEKLFFSQKVFKCSVCGNYLDFDGVNVGRGSANYCPNCGAKMDKRRNDA